MRGFAGSVFLAAFFASGAAAAQQPPAAPVTIPIGDWQLAPTAEVRLRGEYRHDAPDLGGTDLFGRESSRVRDAWTVLERSRIGLGAERGALRAQITLQDARALGSPEPNGTFNGSRGIGELAPYEAFVEMRTSGARPSFIRLGRQAIQWGEGRLIGMADFGPAGRSLDAARAHLSVSQFDFEALAAVLEIPHPLGAGFGDTSGSNTSGVQLYGVTARYTLDPIFKVEAFGIARVARSSGEDLDGSRFEVARATGERYTASLRVSGDRAGWEYGAEGAYQAGKADSIAAGGRDISAWAAYAHVAKTLDAVLMTPTIRAAASYASGDNGHGEYKQFDPLLADPQKFHGQMDLFAWSNMMDVAGRVQVVPWTDTTLGAEYRFAQLAQARGEWVGSYMNVLGNQATAKTAEKGLGHEVDVSFAWRPWTPLELRAGWSGLILGDGAKGIMDAEQRGKKLANGAISPGNIAQYAFGQATLNIP